MTYLNQSFLSLLTNLFTIHTFLLSLQCRERKPECVRTVAHSQDTNKSRASTFTTICLGEGLTNLSPTIDKLSDMSSNMLARNNSMTKHILNIEEVFNVTCLVVSRCIPVVGSSNYRPSAPLLYEVASHVKKTAIPAIIIIIL